MGSELNRYKLIEDLKEEEINVIKKVLGIETDHCYIIVALRRREFEQIKGGLR